MAKKFVVKPENGKVAVLVDGTEIEDVTAYTIREHAENSYAEVTLSFIVRDKWLVFKGEEGRKEDGESNISRPFDPSPGTVSRTGDDHGSGSRPTGGV